MDEAGSARRQRDSNTRADESALPRREVEVLIGVLVGGGFLRPGVRGQGQSRVESDDPDRDGLLTALGRQRAGLVPVVGRHRRIRRMASASSSGCLELTSQYG